MNLKAFETVDCTCTILSISAGLREREIVVPGENKLFIQKANT